MNISILLLLINYKDMESTKNVIEIVKKARAHLEYDEHYYLKNINPELDLENCIEYTGDIWKALKFNNVDNASGWYNFIKTILGKHYEINIKTITLNYTI